MWTNQKVSFLFVIRPPSRNPCSIPHRRGSGQARDDITITQPLLMLGIFDSGLGGRRSVANRAVFLALTLPISAIPPGCRTVIRVRRWCVSSP